MQDQSNGKYGPKTQPLTRTFSLREEKDMLAYYPKKFVHYLRHNRAVSALEYAILVGAIAVAMAAAMTTFSGQIQSALTNIGDQIA